MVEFWLRVACIAQEKNLTEHDSIVPDELAEKHAEFERAARIAELKIHNLQAREATLARTKSPHKSAGGRRKKIHR